MAFGKKTDSNSVTIRITNSDGIIQNLRMTVEEAKSFLTESEEVYVEYGYLEGIGYPLKDANDIKEGMFIPAKQ